jgi:hypothetical protein
MKWESQSAQTCSGIKVLSRILELREACYCRGVEGIEAGNRKINARNDKNVGQTCVWCYCRTAQRRRICRDRHVRLSDRPVGRWV